MRLTISARPWRSGTANGQPATARICCSNCDTEHPSSVQWPELCTRGAISFTITECPAPSPTTNVAAAGRHNGDFAFERHERLDDRGLAAGRCPCSDRIVAGMQRCLALAIIAKAPGLENRGTPDRRQRPDK